MRIYVTRHGQTDLNKEKLMQGLTDAPLNEKGIAQAGKASECVKDVSFDAVYASPLVRARKTASIIGRCDISDVIVDDRIIEVDFGKFEGKKYACLGIIMSMYWFLPEIFPAPKTVETVESMTKRSHAFLRELEGKGYDNVLVVCHGGIIRAICGYLEDRRNGIKWRPKPKNCEIRVYESINGKHRFIESINNE